MYKSLMLVGLCLVHQSYVCTYICAVDVLVCKHAYVCTLVCNNIICVRLKK